MQINTELWEHQQNMLEFALKRISATDKIAVGSGFENAGIINGGFVWWLAGCSTGKTLTSYQLIKEMGYKKTLVITTKAGARSAWIKDAMKHTEGVEVVTAVGESKADKKLPLMVSRATPFVYVINYESAWRIADTLKNYGFEFVIADESHKVKAHNSTQGVEIAALAQSIPHRLAMTGTGFEERPTDAYGQVRYMSPMKKGRVLASEVLGTWGKFYDYYVDYYKVKGIPFINGYKHQEELRAILDRFTMYVDSEEVLTLPTVVDIERTVPMTGKIASAYRSMELDFYAKFGDSLLVADNVLEQGLRLHQITSGYYPHDTGIASPIVEDKDNPKLQETLAILDEIGGHPTVIFTRFREDVAILKRNLEKNGYGVKLLTGEVNQHSDWQDKHEGQVLIANIQAGGTAIDATRARYCIYYSIGHSRSDYIQSLARVRRTNSNLEHPITYYHILMEDSIDMSIRRAMAGKGELADYIKQGLKNRA